MADHVLTRWHWQDRQVSQARLMHVMRARGLRLSRNAVEQRWAAAWLVGLEPERQGDPARAGGSHWPDASIDEMSRSSCTGDRIG